ncbi:hypothetical protein [Sphingomonas sp. 28-63-12]|uniref:hypothetical protein n=1 Tax=Sphingomonas sp. 28-63-12 TaxID=1970434 RepID=UPI000BDBCC9A|nr:MAG: hypothetical protein B7Y47_08800 [Sphingomonas sp. 28-63-12]
MKPYFNIDVDIARDLVMIRMGGFFGPEAIEQFVTARNAAHARLQCGPHEHMTLNDVTDMSIQSQEMVMSFQRLLADPTHRSRKLAFVHASTLARMQLQRAAAFRNVAYFRTAEEAEAWLFEDNEDAIPATRSANSR